MVKYKLFLNAYSTMCSRFELPIRDRYLTSSILDPICPITIITIGLVYVPKFFGKNFCSTFIVIW
jgi:hypothetical protein